MGCTQSKIENEEAVSRCKDRKQFMREAVSARNAFASAQSSYTVALKNSGAALHDYGQGEVQDHRPSQQPTQPSIELPPPPPPLPNFPPPPLQRAATMPEFVIAEPNHNPTEPINEDDEEDNDTDTDNNLIHRRNAGGSVGGGGGGGSSRIAEDPPTPQPPPSPPRTPPISTRDPPQQPDSMEKAWDFFFPSAENMPGPSLSDTHEITSHNDESTTSGGRYKRVEEPVDDGDIGSKSRNEVETPPVGPDMVIEPAMKPVKKSKLIVHSHTSSADAKRVGKAPPNVTLLQILSELDDHFLKAYESAQDVSKMLEANRLHYHSNFADNRGHIDHSARVMRVITWNRSFRGMANVDDGKDDLDKEEHETHATTLDKMLAWEKKLYDEVKAGELMKIEYQRKVASLNKQKKRGTNSDALEKTKAAVSHLHTRYIVDMQSMDSTVSEINRLRDQQLFPKLVALVDGMANMWENMSLHHRSQLKIVNDIKFLDISQAPKETSEHHHDRTVQLWNVVNEWHSQFQKLVTYQKEYIRALNSWLKLNLIPIESSLKEKVSSPPRVEHPPIQALLHTWHDLIEKLPDEGAKSAISSFAAVIKTIMLHQDEEMKLKEKYEETNKELARKNRAFEDWHRKYMERRTPPDDMSLETGEDANHKDPVMERQVVVETLKRRLEEEIEAHRKVCLQVREKSLGSLKTSLPELFRCMSEFALRCSHMYKDLSSISQSHN